MISKMIKSIFNPGSASQKEKPVTMNDLFGDSDAEEYKEDGAAKIPNIVIAPRDSRADLASLEAPLPEADTPEKSKLIEEQIVTAKPQSKAVKNEPPAREVGWDALEFGD